VVDGIDARRLRGQVLALDGDRDGARADLDEALARAQAVGYPAAEQRILAALTSIR